MVDIVIDGIWCPKCRDIHPTLMWHNKYDSYLLDRKEKWDNDKKKRPGLFKDAVYIDNLPALELREMSVSGNCVVCGSKTHFMNKATNGYVCSDECKWKDNENLKTGGN